MAENPDYTVHPDSRGAGLAFEKKEQVGQDLQRAIRLALPTNVAPYMKVKVLMLAWKHAYDTNEVSVKDDFEDMKALMINHFNYEVVEHMFDLSQSGTRITRDILRKCISIMPEAGELLIVYYVGHSCYRESMRFTELRCDMTLPSDATKADHVLYSSATHEARSVSINFQKYIAVGLNIAEGDVLYILDACHSAAAAIDQRREVFAATSISTTTQGRLEGHQTFTHAFCQLIKLYPGPATVAQLHARMIYHYFDPKTSVNFFNTPVHTADTRADKPSIMLARFNADAHLNDRLHAEPDASEDQSYILFKVKFSGTPNLQAVTDWLRDQIPDNIKDIEVEGTYHTKSCVIILKIPVLWWNMLPERAAYRFVDYVRGGNLVVKQLQDELESARLRIQQLQGMQQGRQILGGRTPKENIPFRPGGSGQGKS